MADILRTQSQLLLSSQPGKLRREGPSPLVGASCWLYAVPGAVLLSGVQRPRRVAQAAAWAMQAHLSFQADYVHLLDDSPLHAADRVWAVGLCLHQCRALGAAVAKGSRGPAAAFTALAGGGILCLHNGRTTDSYREYELSHSAWHLLSVSAVVLGMRRFPR